MKNRSVESSPGDLGRRELFKLPALGLGMAAVGGVAALAKETSAPRTANLQPRKLAAPPAQPFSCPPIEEVRIGFVGVGGMGTNHVRNLVQVPNAVIKAVCDIRPAHAERAKSIITEAGFPEPTLYTKGERDFERMCAEEDLDLVFTATPWRWHVPVCVTAMENGKHAATEVTASLSIEGCWNLVETAEKQEKHCVMMENCNYGQWEMMLLNMSRQGVLGDILHAECGYLHDLRAIKFSEEGEGLWRREYSKTHDCNLYPTHGLGPVGQCMDINRGDRFDYVVSMSSPSRGLQNWAEEHFPAGHEVRSEEYVLGDVNVSLIKTAKGRTIYLNHDTNLPRPYSRINILQGTKGIFEGYPNRCHVEGISEPHAWDPGEEFLKDYEHPLWKKFKDKSTGAAHGNMDYLESYRLVECLHNGWPTDMNVYDAASLSAVVELTQKSVLQGSQPMEFPDFTRGRWKTWQPLGIAAATPS